MPIDRQTIYPQAAPTSSAATAAPAQPALATATAGLSPAAWVAIIIGMLVLARLVYELGEHED